ncbi:beta-hydroxyacyl-ACP dehydratase, putative [Plasmodium ovale]|uniref:3-hydroxyacyl-[acyl-carrier-protein] dehydratase n=1 Tax=Plasmodium ovale TaxID=36330 RepID=A0A1C3KVM5_PLAOA|nr:beta-hydroxyacyl-ACP dehydratase, putative [Plasmodium ovale]
MMNYLFLFIVITFPIICLDTKNQCLHFVPPSFEIGHKRSNLKKYITGAHEYVRKKPCDRREIQIVNASAGNAEHAEHARDAGDPQAKDISAMMSFPNYETIDIEDIRNILPHRYPFLLVDKVIHVQASRKIIGIKQVSVNENFFNGHFPEKPIMPGVLQIEALAQLGGILCLKNEENRKENNVFLFAGVDGVRWKKPVRPGDTLVMESELISFKPSLGVAKLRGIAYVDGTVVIKIDEMTFAMPK